ncbi:hypothetical protein DFQ28_004497, partial [Apophysomyces sp. BC1034]
FSDACVWTLGMCLIADTFPLNTLGLQMGKVLLAHSVGLVVGAPVGVLFEKYGYQTPFILCVSLTGVDFFLRLFLVERRNQPKEWFDESATPPASLSETAANLPEEKKKQVSSLQLLSQPRLWASLVVAFSQGTVFNIFEPTLTVRLSTEFGYNSSQIGLVFLAQVIPTFVATPLAGYFSDKYGPKVVSLSSLLLCIVTVALMGVPNASTPGGIAPLIVIFALQGLSAFAFVTPVLPELAYVVQAQNPEGGDDGQGRSYAFFNMAFASGPIIGGYMYAGIGFFWMCITMAVFLLICALPIYFYMGEPGKFIVRQQPETAAEETQPPIPESTPSKEIPQVTTV